MTFDFDRIIDRRGSDSLKWRDSRDGAVTPMWVADMDFASPPCILDALRRRVDHGVFGYPVATNALTRAVVAWAESHYGWQIDPDWIVWLPGLVPGIHVACLALARPGEDVLAFVPVYPPFLSAPRLTGRSLRTVPLTGATDHWTVDVDAFEKAVTPRTKILLFCHPHNPVGRAFSRQELSAVADVCVRHNLVICSDEIHCDLMLEGERHIPFASLGMEIADRTVTLMSPAKTFNLPGLNCGFAVIANRELRGRYQEAARGLVPHPNTLGYAACRAAYEEGEEWRAALIDYLCGNRDLLETFFSEHLPMLPMSHVEATYLAWIDTRWLGKRQGASFFEAAGVRLSDGVPFQGPGFVRLNFGCPRATLRAALQRIRAAVTDRA